MDGDGAPEKGERVPADGQVGDRQDVQLMYEFYTDLRDEVNQSIEFQNRIVIGGGVLIGVAYGLQFSGILSELTMENPTLRLIIAALPTVTLFTIALWIVEQSRMMRAGHYLHFLENKINAELDGVYLTWENWLRDGNTSVYHDAHYVGQMVGYALFLYGLAVLGLLVYAVEFLGVSVQPPSFEWNTLAFVYFLLTLGLLVYLARYTYLIIFHEIDEEDAFERFKEWEARYASDRAYGAAYQYEIENIGDDTAENADD
jgi:hypothetical protein